MTKRSLGMLVLTVFAGSGAGADDPDYQARVLVHRQPAVAKGEKSTDGLAVWGIVPDATVLRPFRGLAVMGFARVVGIAGKPSRWWVEAMGGAFVSANGNVEPVFNARTVANSKHLSVYGETMWNFRTQRLLLSGSVVTPPFSKLRVGVESDAFLISNPSFGFGPRIVAFVPFTRKRATLATSLQVRNRGKPPILRQYLTINW